MDKFSNEMTIEKLGFLKSRLMTIEDVGYFSAVSGYPRNEKLIIKFLIEKGYCFGDAIYFLRKYLLGYMVGELIYTNAADKRSLIIDINDLSSGLINENETARYILEELVLKERIFWGSVDNIFDDIDYFYNLGRLDASVLKKNNSNYFAMILNGSIPYKNAVRSICEYLSGFYYEKEILKLNNEDIDDIEDDVQLLISSGETEFQKTDFHNKAEHILQMCIQ